MSLTCNHSECGCCVDKNICAEQCSLAVCLMDAGRPSTQIANAEHRKAEAIRLRDQGMNLIQIAERLNISTRTAYKYISASSALTV